MRERPIDAKYGLGARLDLTDGKEHLPVLFGDERDSTLPSGSHEVHLVRELDNNIFILVL